MWLDQERAGHEIIKAAPQKIRGAGQVTMKAIRCGKKTSAKIRLFGIIPARSYFFFVCEGFSR